MSLAGWPTDADDERSLHDTVSALLHERAGLADELAVFLYAQDEAIQQADVQELILASCRSNVTALLDFAARAVPFSSIDVSTELLGYTRTMVRMGVTHDSVMRGYRRGTTFLIKKWIEAVGKLYFSADKAVMLIQYGTCYLLGWLEVILDQLSREYLAETTRLSIERSHSRLDEIKKVLADTEYCDAATMTTKLGYRLQGRHLAVVIFDLTNGTSHGSVLDAAVAELGIGARLAVHAGTRSLWCWIPLPQDREIVLPKVSQPVLIGVGRPGLGLRGFAQSHLEALDAIRVAKQLSSGKPATVNYEDVDVLALCTVNSNRALDFVRFELGALSGNDILSIKQRQTLLAFYASDCNFRSTGAYLGLHHNTVRYRVEQIEDRLGRSVLQRRLSLELALHIVDILNKSTTIP